MGVLSDLESRGCQDILIAVTDGLARLSEGARRDLSADDAADLHRPPASAHARRCQLERTGPGWIVQTQPTACSQHSPSTLAGTRKDYLIESATALLIVHRAAHPKPAAPLRKISSS
jgi:hypothetical protein